MKHRLTIITIAFAFIITLMNGVQPSHADAPFYYLLENIHDATCTNNSFLFYSNDHFSTPNSSFDVAQVIQRITTSSTSTLSYGITWRPYWAPHPGSSWMFGEGVHYAEIAPYSVPSGTAYFISYQLIYRGTPGSSSSSSVAQFKCSGDSPRQMTLLSLVNQKVS